MRNPNEICLIGNNSTCQSTSAHETSKFSNPFTWVKVHALVLKLRNHLPEPWQDVIPIENVDDLKTVVKLIFILFATFLIAGIYDMLLLQEGGAL